jgi:two-component system nitrogen regulation response regulator GlnG
VTTAAKPDLLVVDDDPLITDTLDFALSRDFNVFAAASRADVRTLLAQIERVPPLALVDLGLPPLPHRPDEGFRLIADLVAASPDVRIVVLSGQHDEAHARHARTLGAVDFVAKPCAPEELKRRLLATLRFDPTPERGDIAGLIGTSPPIRRLREQIRQSAPSPFPVLIEGESGTGKERVAEALHREGPRATRPFLALNCAAISASLVEPTLFGHARGAFTGATGARAGYFEDADDGTLFLDEIGELPLDLQAKLLRVLENGEFQRVGETRTRTSRARVVAATNRDLRHEARDGRFRIDLYHRLSVFTIQVPPLRELDADKRLLRDHFAARFAAQAGTAPFTLAADAEALWDAYAFPGNVRELRNIVIRLVTRHAGRTVDRAALLEEFDLDAAGTAGADVAAAPPGMLSTAQARAWLETRGPIDLDAELEALQRHFIDAALDLTGGNLAQAARLLGVQRTTLYGRLQSAGREPPARPAA